MTVGVCCKTRRSGKIKVKPRTYSAGYLLFRLFQMVDAHKIPLA